jgi:D-glycero-alpha-D-manno-heptose 1-phosphate guanylyltransferase
MEAIILAGGFGTRLASRLEGVPKVMAPVAGRPFLEIVLSQLRRVGFARVVLSVGYLHETIEGHFRTEFKGMQIVYSIEHAPLGTGGAIRLALAQTTEETVLVLNGDTFLDADYADMWRFHSAERAAVTIAVVQQPDIARYGGVVIDGDRIACFEEKGRSGAGWISAGAYVLNRNLAWPSAIAEKFSIEREFFVPEVAHLRPSAYKVDGQFLDIGIPEDLDRAQIEFARFIS